MQKDCKDVQSNSMISVIMGVYNGERFLREAIESVLQQTYRDFEFIICDDCSVDGSAEILRAYAQKDGRIVLLFNENNLGLAATLNRCVAKAKGTLLARMDSDDIALPNRFEKQVQWLQNNPDVCVLGSAVEYIDDHGKVFGRSSFLTSQTYGIEKVIRGNVLVHPSVMMRKDAVMAVGGYSVNELTTRAEDYDLWCKLCSKGGIVANTGEVLFQYREDESNIVRRKYIYRIQEFKLKWYWVRRARRPVRELLYAIKPLIVGLVPLPLYKIIHRRNLIGK